MSPADLFLWPGALPAALLAPAAWAALRLAEAGRRRRFVAWAGPRADALATDASEARRSLRRSLFAAALALATLAAAGPAWGEGERAAQRRGVDLVVCLDVSRSMLARDADPDRLSLAKREVLALAGRARGDRLALVAFAGEARLRVPLTEDARSFAELTALADPWVVRRGGTDLGAALDRAYEALEGATGAHEAVLLVTDGEDLSGAGLEAARRLARHGVAVHAVGVGTARGGKIAVGGEGGEAFLRDREGREVVSAADPASLGRLAAATGGAFEDASARPGALVRLYEQRVLPMEQKAFDEARLRARENRYQPVLALAVALWAFELLLRDRRRR